MRPSRSRSASDGVSPGFILGLRHDKPSIHIDRLPGDVGGIIRSKKAHQSRNVFGVTPTFKGNSLNPFFHQFAGLIITEKLSPMLIVVSPHVGLDNSGANGVHRNAVGRQFLGQALGKADPTARAVSSIVFDSSTPAYPCEKPVTQIPRANASLVTARIAAFIPGASPPLVSTQGVS
jgi:hypothetical protein